MSCAESEFSYHKLTTTIIADLTPEQREFILKDFQGQFGSEFKLNVMPAPVIVQSIGPVSHGVFREKYVTYDIVVRDGEGRVWPLEGGPEFGSYRPGLYIREALDAKDLE
jgi:hypothetical protein